MKPNFKPFTQNIIFFDSEFSSNDAITREIISLALIKPTGEELYLELEYQGEVSEFVKNLVLPHLVQPKVSKTKAAKLIKDFVGTGKPHLVTYVNQFDFVYLSKIIPYHELPFASVPIDFASILFGQGIDPNDYKQRTNYKLMTDLGINVSKYKPHHALDDTRLLKEVYSKILNISQE